MRAEQEVEEQTGVASPSRRALTGYVTKDTAGQENIYAVEPTIYVADSAISTNSGGASSQGSGGTLIISGFMAVAAVSGATAVLLSVGSTQLTSLDPAYTAPPLSYYVAKFKTVDSVPATLVDAVLAAPEVGEVEVAPSSPSPSPAAAVAEPEAVVAESEDAPSSPSPSPSVIVADAEPEGVSEGVTLEAVEEIPEVTNVTSS